MALTEMSLDFKFTLGGKKTNLERSISVVIETCVLYRQQMDVWESKNVQIGQIKLHVVAGLGADVRDVERSHIWDLIRRITWKINNFNRTKSC